MRIPVRRLPVIPHTAASSMRPPSSGNPGTVFSAAKSTLIRASQSSRSEITPWVSPPATQNTPPRARVVAGPTRATRNSPLAPRAAALVSVAPPQKTA